MSHMIKAIALAGTLGAGLVMAAPPASAQFIGQTEGAYSGRYTQDYDYRPGRGEYTYRGEPGQYYYYGPRAYPGRRPGAMPPTCMDNEGRYCAR